MIEDVIDTLRNPTPAVKGEFIRKNQNERSTCQRVSHSKKSYVNLSFQVTPLRCPIIKRFAQYTKR